MKIGLYISPAYAVPPDEKTILAPWELVSEMADHLVNRGHEVYLFAACGSRTKARLFDYGIGPTIKEQSKYNPQDYRQFVISLELKLFDAMIKEAGRLQLDVIHIHQPVERLMPSVAKNSVPIPLIFTFHDPIVKDRWVNLLNLSASGNCHFISISRAQARGVPLTFAGNVYNGVPLSRFGVQLDMREKSAMFLTVGRIIPEKGFDDAICATLKSQQKLMIAGQVYEDNPMALQYYETEIRPRIDRKHIFFEPTIKRDHLIGHYQEAYALLFPIKWAEPFGLVMVEAMACGTPVIAYNNGSVPEIIRDGVTGFIIEPDNNYHVAGITNQESVNKDENSKYIIKKPGIEGLVEATRRIGEISRADCHRHVAENFSTDRMVRNYEEIYQKLALKI